MVRKQIGGIAVARSNMLVMLRGCVSAQERLITCCGITDMMKNNRFLAMVMSASVLTSSCHKSEDLV